MQAMAHTPQARPRARSALWVWVLASALGLGMVPALAVGFWGHTTVVGSGHMGSVKRELAAFHQIAIDLPCKIELVQGASEGVAIEADDNLLPLIETVVKNGQLTIKAAKGTTLTGRAQIQITVNARDVDALSLAGSAQLQAARLQSPKLAGSIAGSGRITIKDLQSKDLSVSITGSGRFEAQGTAAAMDISIAGAGDVNTARLSTQDVSISIAGSGDATVWARKALSVSIVGSGNVQYYGEASRGDSSTVGSGRVKQLGASPPPV